MKIEYTVEQEQQLSTTPGPTIYKITALGHGTHEECVAYLESIKSKRYLNSLKPNNNR